jgi:hypothetical protein
MGDIAARHGGGGGGGSGSGSVVGDSGGVVCMSGLGRWGQLGNQMLQYMFLRVYCRFEPQ